jgi:antitoxin component of MazEF toxin-antitoxin module
VPDVDICAQRPAIPAPVRFTARLERHQPDLPAFLLVPAAVAEGLGLTETFVVEAAFQDRSIGRRSVKPWGDGRWFMDVTKPHMQALGLAVGDAVDVALSPAADMPAELAAALAAAGLEARWQALTQAVQRQLAESVFAAKRDATRRSRIARIVDRLRG